MNFLVVVRREQQIGTVLPKNRTQRAKTPLTDVILVLIANQRLVIQFRREATDQTKRIANGNQRSCNGKSLRIQQMRPHNSNAK